MKELSVERAAGGKEERRQLSYELWRGTSEKDESSRSRRSLRGLRREAARSLMGKEKAKSVRNDTRHCLWGKKVALAKRAHPRQWLRRWRRVTGNAPTATNGFRAGISWARHRGISMPKIAESYTRIRPGADGEPKRSKIVCHRDELASSLWSFF